MICSNCGTENPTGTKFCKECGSRSGLTCSTCGLALLPDAKFCGECGTSASAIPGSTAVGSGGPLSSPTRAVAPVAERRLVSVLFADLVGFTALSADQDPEETRELLTRYFDLSQDVIGRYGGTVEKFIGDAVMAVWGAPVAREDDAERAVRAALELVDAVRTLGPGLQARAGILTGEAAVTLGATNQGMVAGDLVNTASRLQSAAVPGAVLVGEATQRAASRAIAFEHIGDQTFKGKTAPIPAWRALRVVAEVGGRNRSEAIEAPFVGRDDELRLLKDFFHATAREKRARLVSVIGPAGIGKSRLAWEFLKYSDGLVETVWWHQGRSPAYGDGITFWALGEMVRGRCGLRESDDERTTRAKVAETLATHVPDADERGWIEPALLALLGIEAGVGSDQLFGAWRTFFERLATTAPVIMVLEDFHFADAGLLDFVDHLMEWSKNAPIYVVTLSRPELLEKRPTWGAGKRNFVSVHLEPLPEPAMRELLLGLVPGLPESAVRSIISRADGIPLYAVETVRMLVAEGRLALEDGAYHPVGDLTTLAVPETLTALIASRLDGLTHEDRALVSDAAVLGQSFVLAGLSAVSGIPDVELEPRLRALVQRELLTLEADPRSPERGQYGFVQALIREVAYKTLARADRKVRHLAAARFFEALGSEELAGALAGHYLAAQANAPEGPEADALAGQARIALKAAAERAAALGAHDQTVAFLTQALTVTADPAGRAELLELAGEEASAAGRHDQAEALLRNALDLRRAMGDRAATARTIAALASALSGIFRADAALEVLEPAVQEFADLAGEAAMIAVRAQLARAWHMSGESRRAVEVADSVLEAAEHSDLVAIIADVLVTKGSALGNLGRTYEAVGVIDAGRKLAEVNGLSATVLRALVNGSNYERDLRSALATLRSTLVLARRLGRRRIVTVALGNATELSMRFGEWDWVLNEADAMLADDFDPMDRIQATWARFQVRGLRGDPGTEDAREMEQVFADRSDPQSLGSLADLHGIEAWLAGRYADAYLSFRHVAEVDSLNAPYGLPLAGRAALWNRSADDAASALHALDATGVHRPALEASRTTLRAGLAALEGRSADALALYRESLGAWRDLGLVWDEALCGIDMALLLDPADPDVRAAADSAREILVRLGATPFVERLDAAIRRATPERGSAAAS
jgi:class 3 adenylate cyclase/tetratricopeptide (TPR) repeat protein